MEPVVYVSWIQVSRANVEYQDDRAVVILHQTGKQLLQRINRSHLDAFSSPCFMVGVPQGSVFSLSSAGDRSARGLAMKMPDALLSLLDAMALPIHNIDPRHETCVADC